jgi:pyruvate formate lyase activating enzyme
MIKERKLDGICFREKEKVGKKMNSEEVLKEILKDKIYMDESGGGVTFSGGEPLMQAEFLEEILKECKDHGIHTALDTSGYADAKSLKRIIDLCELFLFDLKLMNDIKHVEYTGVSNEIILQNLKTIIKEGKEIQIRLPVIPGITDTDDNLKDIRNFMNDYELKKIDLLPYHDIARNKYKRANKEYFLGKIDEPGGERMVEMVELFLEVGIIAAIGG